MAIFSGSTNLTGGSADDILLGGASGAGSNLLSGGAGNDILIGDSNVAYTSASVGGQSAVAAWNMTANTAFWSLMNNADVANSTTTPWASAVVEGEGELNWFRFDVTGGQRLTIDIDHVRSTVGGNPDLRVEIIAANGTTVLMTDDSSSLTEGGQGSSSTLDPFVSYTMATTGTYYVRVSANGQVIPVGTSYMINFSLTGQTAGTPTSGSDELMGGAGNDVLYGGASVDVLDGGDNIDRLYGGDADDHLNGGLFKDTAFGGAGNDTFYYVGTDFGDEINGDSGNDTLNLDQVDGISYTVNLGTGVATITGNIWGNDGTYKVTSVENVVGTDLDDAITGSAAANTLNGGTGNDVLNGADGNDVMDGGSGNDTMTGGKGNDRMVVNSTGDVIVEGQNEGTSDTVATSVSYTLQTGVYVETLQTTNAAGTSTLNLTGNAFKQLIVGNAAVNTLDSGTGVGDTLRGLGGSDIYRIRNSTDIIDETTGNGVLDQVQAAVSFVLASDDNIEAMATINAAATTAINLTGNSLAQTITGNAGANILDGKGGNDTMAGGAGADVFVFSVTPNSSTNRDTITDFNVADDTIRLDDVAFTGLALGTLSEAAFAVTTTGVATDASDRIIYNSATGDLWFDRDGTGVNTAVRFATVQSGLSLTNADFAIV